ncbi:MAG: hypothetical protein WCY92_14185, partial [Novosphingobium sp.]
MTQWAFHLSYTAEIWLILMDDAQSIHQLRPSLLPLSRLQTKNGQMRIRGGGEALQRKVTLDERWFHAR